MDEFALDVSAPGRGRRGRGKGVGFAGLAAGKGRVSGYGVWDMVLTALPFTDATDFPQGSVEEAVYESLIGRYCASYRPPQCRCSIYRFRCRSRNGD